jgi:hypothetical protein
VTDIGSTHVKITAVRASVNMDKTEIPLFCLFTATAAIAIKF